MANLTFICDVDSVLLDMDFLIKMEIADRWPTSGVGQWGRIEHSHPRHWQIEEAYGISRKELDSIWTRVWDAPCRALHGAPEFLSSLQRLGVEVIACSSRKPGAARDALDRDMKELLPYLDGVMAVDGGAKKGRAVKEAGLIPKWFLDDSAENVFNFLEVWPETHAMLFDQPWNQSLDLDPPYTRVRTYQHVINLVKKEINR